ncbi:alpha/beta hydrolase [Nicoliella spurrieriana]|uniref:Alpha/beta hydrolase n=1 Tax=Nicoliella spurrieriana TaxID=2925830 RepID=A0A976X5N9_9LACO|nr:alpha/beta fold hydrolase [Nicoliella spurrieriana]UQS87148.1 alpha/beta hydrolase [Nicoliella spurrieriana]
MRIRKKHIGISIILFIEAIIFIFTLNWQFRGNVLNDVQVHKTRTATVFIPGFAGNAVSTDDFIQQFSEHNIASRTLKIGITKNGKVYTIEQYKKVESDNPLVQLVFKDNTHPYKESNQMVSVMRYLKNKYNITSVNLLGHSSGGNIAYYYMVNHPHLKDLPTVSKFVSIAADYPTNDPYAKGGPQNLPKNLEILNIAGEIWNLKSDAEEAVDIVKPMGKLVQPHVKSYQFWLYRSDPLSAEHSMLHENPVIDKHIAGFLFGFKK